MEVLQINKGKEEFWERHQQESFFGVWDENYDAYELFQKCQSQWNVSMSGIIGLNYPALESVMRMLAIPEEKRPELFESIRFIESGYLNAINKRQAEK